MKHTVGITILVFSLFAIVNAHARSPEVDLWQKAVQLYAENQHWMPQKMTMQFEFLNRDDEPEDVTISKYKISVNEDNEFEVQLLAVIHNGENITESELEKQKNSDDGLVGAENMKITAEDSPFHPNNRDNVTVNETNIIKMIEGHQCQGYRYTLTCVDKTKIGTAWLDIETGAPILNQYTTDPLPKRVKEMEHTTHFTHDPKRDLFHIKETQFEGVGGFWFFKKKFRGTITFSNFGSYTCNQ